MRKTPTVAGEPAARRLMRNLDYRLSPSTQPLDEDQVAVVLRALADHTALVEALAFEVPEDGVLPWPEAHSVGRWLHAVADQLDQHF